MHRIPGFEIVKAYDYNPDNTRNFSETFYGRPRVCERLEEMIEDIDAVFITDCDGGGQDHLKLAILF